MHVDAMMVKAETKNARDLVESLSVKVGYRCFNKTVDLR
jgi:hypothetical protein